MTPPNYLNRACNPSTLVFIIRGVLVSSPHPRRQLFLSKEELLPPGALSFSLPLCAHALRKKGAAAVPLLLPLDDATVGCASVGRTTAAGLVPALRTWWW